MLGGAPSLVKTRTHVQLPRRHLRAKSALELAPRHAGPIHVAMDPLELAPRHAGPIHVAMDPLPSGRSGHVATCTHAWSGPVWDPVALRLCCTFYRATAKRLLASSPPHV